MPGFLFMGTQRPRSQCNTGNTQKGIDHLYLLLGLRQGQGLRNTDSCPCCSPTNSDHFTTQVLPACRCTAASQLAAEGLAGLPAQQEPAAVAS